jgi:hypothetical protein
MTRVEGHLRIRSAAAPAQRSCPLEPGYSHTTPKTY